MATHDDDTDLDAAANEAQGLAFEDDATARPQRETVEAHTPGTWLVHEGAVYAREQFKHAPFTSSDGTAHPDYHTGLIALVYQGEANAHLIAAAPTLLDLVRRALEGEGPATWNPAAREAIRQAEGRE